MNKSCLYTYIIIVALLWPYSAVSKNFKHSSDGKVPEIPYAELQQKTDAIELQFRQQMDSYLDKFQFIPVILLILGILSTYCWSSLNKKFQSIIFFVLGFTLTGPYISFFIFKLNINASEVTIFLIGGLTGGLLIFIFYWIGWILSKVFIFLGGALLPILLLVHFGILNLFDQMNNTELIVTVIISVLCGYIMFKLEQYKIVEVILSAIGGAVLIGYLLLWTDGLSNFEILNELKEEDIFVLKHIENKNQAILIIILAVTGMIVQAALLAIKRRYKVKSASKSKEKVIDQVQVS